MLIMRHASALQTKLLKFMNELFKELPTLWTCGCIIVLLLSALMEILTLFEGNFFITLLALSLCGLRGILDVNGVEVYFLAL